MQPKTDDIKLMATSLAVGDTVRGELCPFCEGGRTGERTFGIIRTARGALYNCFRASCGASGGVTIGGTSAPAKEVKGPKFQPRHYPYSTYDPEAIIGEYVFTKYEITPATMKYWGVKWGADEIVIPIRNPIGYKLGHVTKCFSGKKKKNDNYKASDEFPFIAFFTEGREGTVYIVEDCLSAMKLWQMGFPSIALLGTSMSAADALYMSKYWQKAKLLLDRDAFDVSVKIAKACNLFFDKLGVRLIDQDIKDTAQEDIEGVIK